jgi:hypothetical protein
MSRLLPLGTLVTMLVLLAGCSSGSVYEKLGVDTTIPFDDGPPQASDHDPDIQKGAIDAANEHSDVDYRWAVITTDWEVQRAADAAGNMNIVGRSRDVWAGGVATKKQHNGLWNEGDCVYKLMAAQQEHQGGGNYGAAQFVFQVHGNTYYRLPCETDEQMQAATPPSYRDEDVAGADGGTPSADASDDSTTDSADDSSAGSDDDSNDTPEDDSSASAEDDAAAESDK